MTKKTKATTSPAVQAADPRGPLDITLAGRVFSVPPLPLRWNREVYPLCARLTAAGLLDRLGPGGTLALTADDIDALAEIAFWGASAADSTLTRDEFEALPIAPTELVDAFILIRVQTGGWLMVPSQAA